MAASATRGGAPEAAGGPAPATRPYALPRARRIGDKTVFQAVFDAGAVFPGRYLVMRLRRGPGTGGRLGVVAGKRALPRAVDRARAKRLMREAFRLNRAQLKPDCDVVLIARSQIHGTVREDVERDFVQVARRAHIWDVAGKDGTRD